MNSILLMGCQSCLVEGTCTFYSIFEIWLFVSVPNFYDLSNRGNNRNIISNSRPSLVLVLAWGFTLVLSKSVPITCLRYCLICTYFPLHNSAPFSLADCGHSLSFLLCFFFSNCRLHRSFFLSEIRMFIIYSVDVFLLTWVFWPDG